MNRSPSPHVLAVAQPRFGFGSGGRRLRTTSRDRGSDARASSGGASGGQDGGGGGGADGGSKEGGSVADSTASTSNASGDSKPPALLPANRRVSSSLKPLPPPPRARSRGTTRARRLFASLSSPRNMLLASSGTSDRDDDKGGGGGGGAGNNGGLTSVGTEGGADVDDQTSFGGSNPMMRNRKLPSQRSTSLRTVTSAERRGSELPVNTDDTSTPPAVVDLRDLFEGVAVQVRWCCKQRPCDVIADRRPDGCFTTCDMLCSFRALVRRCACHRKRHLVVPSTHTAHRMVRESRRGVFTVVVGTCGQLVHVTCWLWFLMCACVCAVYQMPHPRPARTANAPPPVCRTSLWIPQPPSLLSSVLMNTTRRPIPLLMAFERGRHLMHSIRWIAL